MEPFWLVTLFVMVPGVLYASWIDYAKHMIPNWLNASIIVAGFIAQAYFFGFEGMYAGLQGMLLGFGLLIVPWLMHAMGGGDVKLMAAIGVWFGPWMTFLGFGLGAIIGGAAAIIMTVATGRLQHALANMNIIWLKLQSKETRFSDFGSARSFGDTSMLLPYGVPLTAGSLVVLLGHVTNWWVL